MRFLFSLQILSVFCGLLFCSQPSHGDSAADARTRYQTGQQFYDQGKYEEAIAEFQAAYAARPHPNVLYNIAQAYERLLEYDHSVTFFERYLKEAPLDAEFRPIVENRLRILRSLPARISVTSIPEHVHVRLSGKNQSYEADAPTLFKVPSGHYHMELALPGWENETHDLDVDIGQPYFYQYRLKRSTSPLSIFSRPRGARVFLDNRLVGETPFADTVEVGKHKLLLEHPDFPWHREDIDVEHGKPLKMEIKLTRPVRSGRTELVLASMVYGGAVGPMVVSIASPSSNFINSGPGIATYLLSSAAGLGIGFLGSFLPTKDGIKVGHSSLIIGGGALGTTVGIALGLGLKIETPYVLALGLLGGSIGITSGVLVSRWKDTSAGDAAIVNSGAFWGTATGVLLAQAIFSSPGTDKFGWFILGGSSLGVLAGALSAWKLELSRGHVALVDVGGLGGTGLGFALGFVLGNTSAADNGLEVGARYALGGMVVGILAASILSRNYKGDLPPVEALLTRHHGQFAMGIPALRFESGSKGDIAAPKLSVDLVKGVW